MKTWVVGCLMVAAAAGRAEAGELFYKWEKGATHRFVAKSDDTVQMSGMGFNMKQRYFTSSTFSLSVDRVKKDGSAEATLSIESFQVKDEGGHILASLDGLPPSAVKNLVEVDRKGGFVFKEEVYLIVDDQGENFLVSGSGSATSLNATARADGQEVTTWASFDPKTGALSAGYSIKEIGKKKKKIKVKQDKPRVDLVPRAFMELLRLPDGDVGAGDGAAKIEMKVPNLSSSTKVTAQLLAATETLVKIKTTFATANETNVPTSGEDAEEDGESAPAMPSLTGMPGMEGINVPGMGGGGGGGKANKGVQMGMSAVGDATIEMNPSAGTLQKVSGTIKTETNAGGMMTVANESKLELVRKN